MRGYPSYGLQQWVFKFERIIHPKRCSDLLSLCRFPVIISNLWDVTDKDIDRFGKAMLEAWLTTRSNISVDCVQCNEISDKLKELNIDGDKGKGKKKTSRSKSVEVNTCTLGCKHRPKIGSFMGKAREACILPFLIGAAPVCYGVPTGIWNKDL